MMNKTPAIPIASVRTVGTIMKIAKIQIANRSIRNIFLLMKPAIPIAKLQEPNAAVITPQITAGVNGSVPRSSDVLNTKM